MSLQDRLNKNQKPNPKIEKIKEAMLDVNYYASSEEAMRVTTLGILDTILADDEINNIFVNGAKNIYIEKRGKKSKSQTTFRDDIQLENIVKKYLDHCGYDCEEGRYFNVNHKKGINLSITLPPFSEKITLNIKCYNDEFASLKTLQELQVISKEIALVLETLCSIKVNILIAGDKKTLKTTILSALSKSIPDIQTGVIVDYLNEIKTLKNNCAYYDFSYLDNFKEEENFLNKLVFSNPDKIFINNPKEEMLEKIIKLAKNNRCFITTLEADSFEEVKEKIKDIGVFDLIIETKKSQDDFCKISSISQIINGEKEEIFSLNDEEELISNGILPKFFERVKENSTALNPNIFDKEYIHTYQKISNIPLSISVIEQEPTKKINLEVLKKFKKETSTSVEEFMKDNERNI